MLSLISVQTRVKGYCFNISKKNNIKSINIKIVSGIVALYSLSIELSINIVHINIEIAIASIFSNKGKRLFNKI